jgi:tyrosine-protein kinase Etk/Wzc
MPEEYYPPPVWEDQDAAGKPIDLMVVLSAFIRRWPFIAAMGVGGGLLALTVAFLLTPKFASKAVFLPPAEHVSALENPLAALIKTPSTSIYSGLLLSDTVLGDVVEHSNLQKVFKSKDNQDARVALRRITQVSADTSGFVSIEVTDKDPKLAQQIAANFLSALARLNDRMSISAAAQQRRVYQNELQHEKDELENAEIELEKAQEASGVVLPQSQTQAGLLAIDTLRAEIRAQQVRLTGLVQAETDQAPDVVRLRSQIEALEAQLHRLETGTQGTAGGALTASKAPEVNLEFVRLEREVKYHQTLFDVMAKQFENAKMEETSAAPGVQVVDYPEVPIRKSWPPRSLFALGGGFLGVFFSLVLILVKKKWNLLRSDARGMHPLAMLRDAWTHTQLSP